MNNLLLNETDIDGALQRFSRDESLYLTLLDDFVGDTTMDELEAAVKNRMWDDAFTAAHALKGLAGNMGFVPLFHSIGELVMLIRAGKVDEVDASFKTVRRCYSDIVTAILMSSGPRDVEK